jgi:hypothetical protein
VTVSGKEDGTKITSIARYTNLPIDVINSFFTLNHPAM